MDWADGKARDWLEHHMTGDDEGDYASLAALLREVYGRARSETLVRCCICEDVRAPRPDCECVICHRNHTLAEVRRVVADVRIKPRPMRSDLWNMGRENTCAEILSRLEALK